LISAAGLRIAPDLGTSEILTIEGDDVDRSVLKNRPEAFLATDQARERFRHPPEGAADRPFALMLLPAWAVAQAPCSLTEPT
jgi:hypothetical protein